MQRITSGLLAALAVVAIGVFSCSNQLANGPKPGDTVMPSLGSSLNWTAGQSAKIGARLTAQGKDEGQGRSLDFISGVSANPVATVTFFDGDEQLGSPVETVLSHRC